MQKFGKLWRSYKFELSRRVRNNVGARNLERVIALTKPDNIRMVEWRAFVKSRTSKAFIVSFSHKIVKIYITFDIPILTNIY